MDSVTAKFICVEVTDQPSYEQKHVHLLPVTADCEENKSFAKYTPSGHCDLFISYETPAHDFFVPGNTYLLEFTATPIE